MKNNITYNGNTNNIFVIIFLIGSQLNKNSQRCYFAWQNLQGGFCDFHFCSSFCCSFLFFILLLCFISFPGCFAMSAALHPSFSGPWRPPLALSSTPTIFDCLCFLIYRKRYDFEWGFFYPQTCFLPYAPSIFDSTCVYEGLPGSRQFFLEVCMASYWSSKQTHLFVWFTAIHNLHIQKNLFLNSTIHYHEFFVVKSLVYMLLTRFELFSLVQSICKDY